MQEKNNQALVRFDATGHFEIVDDALIAELGPQDTALVTGGAVQTDVHCGQNNTVCANAGCLHVNGLCRSGTLDVACHGDHTLNGIC
jgi:hypothetical protein